MDDWPPEFVYRIALLREMWGTLILMPLLSLKKPMAPLSFQFPLRVVSSHLSMSYLRRRPMLRWSIRITAGGIPDLKFRGGGVEDDVEAKGRRRSVVAVGRQSQ